jgi:tetratricopeptide (TPR) repeat protein
MPVAARIVLGVWEFQEAAAIAVVCFALAAYLDLRSRGRIATLPDSAAMIDRASRLTASGRMARAISVLTRALGLDRKLWQAFQYRAELRASQGDYRGALDDISEAIRLAPDEPHLYLSRTRLYSAMDEELPAADKKEG